VVCVQNLKQTSADENTSKKSLSTKTHKVDVVKSEDNNKLVHKTKENVIGDINSQNGDEHIINGWLAKKDDKNPRGENSIYVEGISVITPSYKGEKHILKFLESMENQELSYDLFDIIIVINGELDETPQIVKGFKEKNPKMNIKLRFSEIANVCHARNIAIAEANRKYTTFIDDDDYVSPNYLKEMHNHASENRIVVAGFVDVDENTGKMSQAYVTPELHDNSGIVEDAFNKIPGALTVCTSKLMPTDKVKQTRYNEELKNGVDTPFYCSLYSKNKFEFYVIDKEKKAVYYRLYRDNSLSRRPLSYEFNVVDRLKVIKDLDSTRKISEDIPIKNFIKGKIDAQTSVFINRYLAKNPQDVGRVCRDVANFNLDYFPYHLMNKDLAKKLVISYNFPPYVCTSGNNMAKLICEKEEIVDVIHNKLERAVDEKLNLIADEFIDKKILLETPYTFNEWNKMKQFCDKGMERINKIVKTKGEYEEIYSLTLFPASHLLAFEYKIKYPNVKWTAEFDDPIMHDIKGNIRTTSNVDLEYLGKVNKLLHQQGFPKHEEGSLIFLCEYLPYVFADELVFCNENQKKFMISEFPYQEIVDIIEKKSRIESHPIPRKGFYNVIESDYELDDNFVNLAYFGSFYETRNLNDVFIALYGLNYDIRIKCKVHFFTSDPESFKEQIECIPVNAHIEVNPYVNFFEFLNLTKKFDCLIVNDADTKDYMGVNPYVPSKLSDYLGSGTDIWIIYEEGSVMSKYDVGYKSILNDIKSTRKTLQKIIFDHL
jgi:poly(ribitol-phosphate) beta-N-acetylglucosaminyltransferase